MTQKNPITPEGAARLREELINLKSVQRPAIIQAIAVAREHGDLSENAEYHAARDKQSFIEGRIKDIENKLALAEVIDPSKLAGTRVAFGAFVKLSNVDSGEEVSYQILGADEADLAKGSISITSPLARSLVGKEVGDEVKMRMPGGERTYEVLDISFGTASPNARKSSDSNTERGS
jgi:transcription elongation factor GreA